MALTLLQQEIVDCIKENRSPTSHFGGGSVLNTNSNRLSRDFDIFHDAIPAVVKSADLDFQTLKANGFAIKETSRSRPQNGFIEALVERSGDVTEIQWCADSAVRFFPIIPDKTFGWRLHDIDLAINKVLALAGRREARDYVDIVTLARSGTRLISLVWAAPAKDPGFTPDLLLDEISRHSSYSEAELQANIDWKGDFPDIQELKKDFLAEINHARDCLAILPMNSVGIIYADAAGRLADPSEVFDREDVLMHVASVGGCWPAFPEDAPERIDPTSGMER